MSARIRLREQQKHPMWVGLALERIMRLLTAEHWTVALDARGAEAMAPDTLTGEAPELMFSWDPRILATHGKIKVWVKGKSLRVRYRPSIVGFGVTALVVGYVAGWPIREYVQYLTQGDAAAHWFVAWHRYAQAVIGLALAWPLLRWRFTRMCRKAVRLNPAQWERYASAAHFWRRVAIAAGVVGWYFVESVYTWLDLGGGFGWSFVRMVLLGVATFAIDWDVLFELPRRALAAMSKRYTD